MIWACIEKRRRRILCRQKSDGNGGVGEKKERKKKSRWLVNMKNDLSEKELSGRKCKTVLIGGFL